METTISTIVLQSPDVSITKTEIFDVDFARQIADDKNIPKDEREKLKRYLKNRVRGNQHETTYKLGKYCKHEALGRFCALRGESLQCIGKEIRNALASQFYWDLDMVNAQPTLLYQYAKQKGWKCESIKQYIDKREELLTEVCETLNIERWEAKDKVIAMFFGCGSSAIENMPSFFTDELYPELRMIIKNNWEHNKSILKWLEKQPNCLGKGLADILQTEERKCLLTLDRSLAKHGRSMDVFMHDGGLVRKKENETCLPKSLIHQLEKDIETETGYKLKLLVKDMKTSFVKQTESNENISSDIVVDDAFSAKKFAELCEDNIVFDSGIVWVFDNTVGIWSCDETHIQRVITNFGEKLIFKQNDKIFNYSGIVKNTKNLMIKLPDVLPKKDGFMLSKSHSDIGKLLFTNGIYDFYTGEFKERFDSSIVFRNAMPRSFPKKDQEKINYIRQISFIESFADEDTRNLLLHNLMRASIGDFRRKKMTIGLGFTNSGKGMLTQLVRTSFGNYCSSFNGNSMIGSYDGNESSKKNGWISDIVNSRFAFSSEIQVDEKNRTCIDGNLLKSIVSGGDEIKARKLYENDKTIINKASLFILANDMPRISPVDDAIRNRVQVINWSYSYVDEPKKTHEKICNPELSNLYKQDEYGNAFFWLMVEEFEKWKMNGFVEPKTPECVIQGRDDLLPIIDIEEVLLQKYKITKSLLDHVETKDILDWLKENDVKDSDNKIGRELTALGLNNAVKKLSRKTIRIRTGIRELQENE